MKARRLFVISIAASSLMLSCKTRKVATELSKTTYAQSTTAKDSLTYHKADSGGLSWTLKQQYAGTVVEETTLYPTKGATGTFADGKYTGSADSIKYRKKQLTDTKTEQKSAIRYQHTTDSLAGHQTKQQTQATQQTKHKITESKPDNVQFLIWLTALGLLAYFGIRYLKN
jgi:hypothetical protein